MNENSSRSRNLKFASSVAKLFDSAFKIPGTDKSIGLDGLIGLIPGVGDGVSSAVSAYLVYLAYRDGVSRATAVRMLFNILVDAIIGAVPIVGDFTDFFWKANVKNIELWEKRQHNRPAAKNDALFIGVILLGFLLVIGSVLYVSVKLFIALFSILGSPI